MGNKKISEVELLSRLQEGATLLPPLVIAKIQREVVSITSQYIADAVIEAVLPENPDLIFSFTVEAKSQSTPMIVQRAMLQAKEAAGKTGLPMVIVPYLAPERLTELERAQVSGVDLCGNGIVIVPGRLYIMRTGQPNRYRESRPLNNPYRGRSAMVARTLIRCSLRSCWSSLNELAVTVEKTGTKLAISQVSKAVQALENDMIIHKNRTNGNIILFEPDLLLDKLGSAWRKPIFLKRQALRLPSGVETLSRLSSDSSLRWAITGESSVTRYATFAQGGPLRVAVSDLPAALKLLEGTPEPVLNFADVELVETDEEGFFFGNEVDEKGLRWASMLQTWLELSTGDARQKEAARDLRSGVLNEEWLRRGNK